LPIHFMWPSHQSYLKYKIWPQWTSANQCVDRKNLKRITYQKMDYPYSFDSYQNEFSLRP
jgi:hypothetical protein